VGECGEGGGVRRCRKWPGLGGGIEGGGKARTTSGGGEGLGGGVSFRILVGRNPPLWGGAECRLPKTRLGNNIFMGREGPVGGGGGGWEWREGGSGIQRRTPFEKWGAWTKQKRHQNI